MLASVAVMMALLAFSPGTRNAPVKRGNEAFARRSGPIFTVGASPRLGVLFAGGAQVIQPVGFGAGLSFRVHGLHLGPLRFGIGAEFGHTRYLERRQVTGDVDGSLQTVDRYAALGHTDFGAGPTLQLVLGPVYVQGDFTAGLGISTFSRPLGVFTIDEDHHSDVSAMIRGGGLFGVPIRNNQAVTVGAAVHRYFSRYQLVANPPLEMSDDMVEPVPDTNPFDLMMEISLGYAFMF